MANYCVSAVIGAVAGVILLAVSALIVSEFFDARIASF